MSSAQANQPFAQRFFLKSLPFHVSQNIEKFAALAGTIAFYIREQGKWTLRLGDLETPVEEGMSETADLKMWFAPRAFAGFIDGTLDIAQAVAAQDIKFEGDVSLLEKFGLLLTPPANAVSARFNR